MPRSFAHLTLGLAAGLRLAAQAPEDSTLKDLMELLNTPVSTASKRAERAIEAPGVISLVTRDQLRDYGWESLNDVLYNLPGFGASRDYDRRTVASRGLFEGWNNNHLLHLVDGIPMNDALYGTAYTWEISPLFLARSVEVVRGPGSALYGSNATNGVVQVRTLSIKDLLGAGEMNLRLGQRGERVMDVLTGARGDHANLTVGFSTFRTDGDPRPSVDGSLRPAPGGGLAAFPVQERRGNSYLWMKAQGEGTFSGWSLQYHRQAWDYQTGHGWIWFIPDRPEDLREVRETAALAYSGTLGKDWSQEYLVRVQRHDLVWNLRFYPEGGAGYGHGLNEFLDTGARDVFGRAQWSVNLPKNANLLFGVEATRFEYNGDRAHTSNVDLVTFLEHPGNATQPQGPWLEWLKDHPMLNTGFYAQFTSGALLGEQLKAVLGVRADRTAFDFTRPGTGITGSRSFSQTSPRLALVYMPAKDFALKAMWGRAFRSPAPAELGGANTFTLASNLDGLKPETLDTLEVAADWIVNGRMNWRTNLFRTRFNDQIAYSAANANLSTNIYSLTTQGLESELLFRAGNWQAFVNASVMKRTAETSLDRFVAASPDALTWEPKVRFKAGLVGDFGVWQVAGVLRQQGAVARRSSEVGTQTVPGTGTEIDLDAMRARSLDGYLTVDARLGWTFHPGMSLSLQATNLMDTDKNRTVKVGAFPFDYLGDRRKVSLLLRVAF